MEKGTGEGEYEDVTSLFGWCLYERDKKEYDPIKFERSPPLDLVLALDSRWVINRDSGRVRD